MTDSHDQRRSTQSASDPAQALDHWRRALALYDELATPQAGQVRAQLAAGQHSPREPFAAPAREGLGS